MRCLALLAIAAAGCASARPASHVFAGIPETAHPSCEPISAAGIELGASLGSVGNRCLRAGHEWTSLDNGGRCDAPLARMPYPSSVRVVAVALEVVAVHVRFDREFGGTANLDEGASALLEQLEGRYGHGTPSGGFEACPGERAWECVLAGSEIAQVEWTAESCGTATSIVLRAEGDRTAHDWRVSITYYTDAARGALDFDHADL